MLNFKSTAQEISRYFKHGSYLILDFLRQTIIKLSTL